MYSEEVVKATKVTEEMVQPEASSTLRAGGGATDIFNSCIKSYDEQNSLLLAVISPWKRGDSERNTSKKPEKRLEMPAVKTFVSVINKNPVCLCHCTSANFWKSTYTPRNGLLCRLNTPIPATF